MNERIIQEIMEGCNWKEKVIIRIFKRLFIKVFHNGRLKTVNSMLEKSMVKKKVMQ